MRDSVADRKRWPGFRQKGVGLAEGVVQVWLCRL
jgi:hypothetical protein